MTFADPAMIAIDAAEADMIDRYTRTATAFLTKLQRHRGQHAWPAASMTFRAIEQHRLGLRPTLSHTSELADWMLSVGLALRGIAIESDEFFVHPSASDVLYDILALGRRQSDVASDYCLRLPQVRVILEGAIISFVNSLTARGITISHREAAA